MSKAKENQLKELTQLTQDPSVIPTDQHDTILQHFDELTKQYPYYASLWASYIKMKIYQLEQSSSGELVLSSPELEKLIGKSIQYCNSFEIWYQYLRYVKLKNSIIVNGRDARNIILDAYNAIWNKCFSKNMEDDTGYDFVKDYLKFLNEWQPQDKYEKNDKVQFIRKVYCQCFSTPIKNIEKIWSEYTNWEQALDSIKCRKQISQVSGEYMKSRGLFTEWQTKMSNSSKPGTLKYYLDCVEWEKEKQLPEMDARIDYVYKQALQKKMFDDEKIWYCFSLSHKQFEKKTSVLEYSLNCLSGSLPLTIYLAELYEQHDKNLYTAKIKEIFEKLITNYNIEEEKELLSNIYLTFMNTMNRIEGLPGSRKVFNTMRLLKDKLDYRVFFENAKLEYRADSRSVTPTKVLELGLKYHTINNSDYVYDYLKFLMDTNQPLNVIKTVFENYDENMNVSVLDSESKTLKSKHIYRLMIDYELKMKNGNIENILKLQNRYKSKFAVDEIELFDIFEMTRTRNLQNSVNYSGNSILSDNNMNSSSLNRSENGKIRNIFDNINHLDASASTTQQAVQQELTAQQNFASNIPTLDGTDMSANSPFIELPVELAELLSKLPRSQFFPDQVLRPEMLCKFLADINIDSITAD